MRTSLDAKEDIGMSSKAEKFSVMVDMDDNKFMDSSSFHDLDDEFLKSLNKKGAMSFFNEYDLINH
jgi:hypothetical protein